MLDWGDVKKKLMGNVRRDETELGEGSLSDFLRVAEGYGDDVRAYVPFSYMRLPDMDIKGRESQENDLSLFSRAAHYHRFYVMAELLPKYEIECVLSS